MYGQVVKGQLVYVTVFGTSVTVFASKARANDHLKNLYSMEDYTFKKNDQGLVVVSSKARGGKVNEVKAQYTE